MEGIHEQEEGDEMRGRTAMAALAALLALSGCEVSIGSGGDEQKAENSAAPATQRFVNSRENARSEDLRRHYVDFSFEYPANWTVTDQPTDGTAHNYVRVAAPSIHGYVPYAFHVGHAAATGDPERDRQLFEELTPEVASQFGEGLEDYRIVSIGRMRVGEHDSYGWRFTATGPPTQGEPGARIYGRGDIVVPPGSDRGVTLISMATDRAEGVDSAEEVGEEGPLRAVLDSFRIEAGGGGGEAGK
ncbi:MAG: hypothetical protein M3N07_08800 [Pseudomonadota bacterium]|nr:hypothetical protein [Pseudomonadota bacterium]